MSEELTSSPSNKKRNKMANDDEDSSKPEMNCVRKAFAGAAQKAGDVSKGAFKMVKEVSHHSVESIEDNESLESVTNVASDGESTTDDDSKVNPDSETKDGNQDVLSERSAGRKVAAATKKTLAKPINATKKATKKAITSTGAALNLKRKNELPSPKQESTVSDMSNDATDAGGDTTVEAGDTVLAEDSNATTTDSKEKVAAHVERDTLMIYMGPVLSFLLHDATIATGSSLLIAAYPTFVYWDLICENQIPLSVTLTWTLVAFAIGYEVALFRSMPVALGVEEDITYEDLTVPSEIDVPISETAPPKRGYSIVRRMSVKFPKRLKFQMPRQRRKEHAQSTLTTKRGEQPRWQRRARAPVSNPLMRRLLRNPSYQRRSVEVEEQVDIVQEMEEPDKDTHMGAYDLPDAESLRQDVVEPLFHLRGMDIFLTGNLPDGAEDNISQHPFLLENGLRDTPCFIINAMTQWANILIYFEMPSWVKDWNNIVEEEDDPDDVKALKRFLNGNDEYKSLRLKMLPYVVDGPLPIRVLAPPKREMTVHCDMLPTKWRQSGGTTRSDGRYLYPCLELDLDLMANKMMRGFSSLVNRHLHRISVDVAFVINKPDMQQEDEPSACLGMGRFDRVDVSECPNLPERLGQSVRADTIRATMLLQQTEMDIQSVRQELEVVDEEDDDDDE